MEEKDNDGNVESRDDKEVKDPQLLQECLIGFLQYSLLSQEYTSNKFEGIGCKVVPSKGVKLLDISEKGTQESHHGMVTYSFYLKRRFEAYSDLPPRTRSPSKLDLGPLEVHSREQNRVLETWGVWPPAPAADRPRRCEPSLVVLPSPPLD